MLVNGQEFSYGDIRFGFLGNTDVKGVKSINWENTQEKPNLYGSGYEPVAIGKKSKEYSGEIELMQKELIAIRRAAGVASIVDVPPFDIVLELANGTDPAELITLGYARFEKDGMEGATGDEELPVSIPFKFSTLGRVAA